MHQDPTKPLPAVFKTTRSGIILAKSPEKPKPKSGGYLGRPERTDTPEKGKRRVALVPHLTPNRNKALQENFINELPNTHEAVTLKQDKTGTFRSPNKSPYSLNAHMGIASIYTAETKTKTYHASPVKTKKRQRETPIHARVTSPPKNNIKTIRQTR